MFFCQQINSSASSSALQTGAPSNCAIYFGFNFIDDPDFCLGTAFCIDIGSEVLTEIDYEVLQSAVIVPSIQLNNEQGACIFVSHDWQSGWREKPRPVRRFKSVVKIPGNLLSEGPVFVSVAAARHIPPFTHFNERDVVTFNISEGSGGETARGDLSGPIPGVVRPLLEWTTD